MMTKDTSAQVLRRLAVFDDEPDTPPTREELEAEAARADALDAELDPRWSALAHGAALDDAHMDDAPMTDAFRPLDASFREQVVDSLRTRSEVATPPAPSVVARRRIGPRTIAPVMIATAFAAAAALALVALPRDIDPLPSYALELRSGDHAARGAETVATSTRHAIGSRLELVARPREALAPGEQVVATAFVVRDGASRAIDGVLRVADGGAVRLVGTIGADLPLEIGTSELAIVITRPDAAPRTLSEAGDDAIVLRATIEVVAAP